MIPKMWCVVQDDPLTDEGYRMWVVEAPTSKRAATLVKELEPDDDYRIETWETLHVNRLDLNAGLMRVV